LSYWQFRLRIYNQSLQQWLDSLKQISLAIVALFPLALPALLFLPFLAWGVLADAASTNELYLNTLWGYLLFLYSWMRLQRQAILASQYSHYLRSLPLSSAKRSWCELGLILYSANLFLLGPLFLFCVMFQQSANSLASLPLAVIVKDAVPITGLLLLASYYSVSAVHLRKLPWLSLLLLPLLAMPWASELTKGQWLVLWCVAILVERQVPIPTMTLGAWPKGIYRLLLRADITNPRSEGLRLVALLLMAILLGIGFDQVKPDAKPYIAGFLSFYSAVLMASSLFDARALIKRYQYYLASLPMSPIALHCHSLAYVIIKAVPGLLLLALFNLFESFHWALWLVFYLSSLAGILYRAKWFLLFPIATAIVVLMFYI
jgi:hypothetical protein